MSTAAESADVSAPTGADTPRRVIRWPGGPTYEDNSIVPDQDVDWSPADNPGAIAVSEIQWWAHAAELAVLRMRGSDDHRISWFSSRQIDARQLILALRQLLSAVALVVAVCRSSALTRTGTPFGWRKTDTSGT